MIRSYHATVLRQDNVGIICWSTETSNQQTTIMFSYIVNARVYSLIILLVRWVITVPNHTVTLRVTGHSVILKLWVGELLTMVYSVPTAAIQAPVTVQALYGRNWSRFSLRSLRLFATCHKFAIRYTVIVDLSLHRLYLGEESLIAELLDGILVLLTLVRDMQVLDYLYATMCLLLAVHSRRLLRRNLLWGHVPNLLILYLECMIW